MNTIRMGTAAALLAGLISLASAYQTLPAGTEVHLKFDEGLSSRTAKIGDDVRLHVHHDVVVNGQVMIPDGTKVHGVIATVSKNGRFGKNAHLRISLDPIHVNGREIDLEPRDKGKDFGGNKTNEAAAASGGGLILLGPIGLAGGYFVAGHSVVIKPGDNLRTEVSRSVHWR